MTRLADAPTSFRSVSSTARALNVPASWLRSEAEAGRVPALRAGRRLLFDLDAVRAALVNRSLSNATT